MTHPQLVKIENLVRRLEEAMERPQDGAEKTLFTLAGEYAEHCKRANDRLQVCAEIASRGKDMEYQALIAATRAPDLLDLCAVLSELQTDEWRDFCRHNHLPVPDALLEAAKQMIDPIYARAGTFHRKLMEEYSAANSKKDFREALRVIRQVSRLNPSDANASTQAQRLEDRLVRELVKSMELPLKDGDIPAVLQKLEEIEVLAPGRSPKEDEASERPWVEGLEIRRNVRRDEAIEQCSDLMADAETAWQEKNLEEVLGLIGRVSALMEEHEFTLRSNLRDLHAEIGQWADEEVMRLKVEDRFRAKLNGLRETIRTIRDKELQSRKPTLEEYREDSFLIQRLWKEIAEFRKPVPAELQDDAQKILGELNEKAALLEKRKRRLVILGVAAAAIVLVASAVIAVFFWKAKEMRDQIARSVEERRAKDVEARIAELEAAPPVWFIFSGLPGEIERAKSWSAIEQANAARVNEMLAALESELQPGGGEGEMSAQTLAALKTRIAEAETAAGEVCEDFRSGLADRISALEGEWKRVVSAKRDLIAKEFHEKLEQLDAKVREGLSLDQPPAQLEKSVTETSSIVADLESLAQVELDELKPLTSDLTKYGPLKTKFTEIEEKVNRAGSLITASREASSLEDYLKSIKDVGDSGVLEGSQKLAHMNLLLKVRSEESVLMEILTPGNVSLWTRLKEGTFSAQGFPPTLEGEEVAKFLSLRDDENLGEIFRYPVTEEGRTRHLHSRGEMRRRESRLGDVLLVEAAGDKVFDPAKGSGTAVAFGPVNFAHRKTAVGASGLLVGEGSRSPESVLSTKIRLAGFADASVTNYRDSLLRAVDRIFEAGEGVNPLFKAYLHVKLGELMMARKDQWLLDFTDFEKDYLELKGLVDRELTSSDWMVPSLVEEYGGPLGSYYSKHAATRYGKSGQAIHRVYERLFAGGLEFHGFVDLKKALELSKPADEAKALWGCDKNLKIVKLFVKAESGDWEPVAEAAAFSPVFSLVNDPDKVLADAAETFGVDPASPAIRSRLPKALFPEVP